MVRKINQFKALQKIHTAMLLGMVIFCLVSAVVHLPKKLANDMFLNKALQVAVLAVTFVLIKLGTSLFEKKLNAIPAGATAADKMAVYKLAAVLKWIMIEGPVLFAVVSFMITRNYAFIVLAFALIIFFAFQGPGKIKMMLQLQLSDKEAKELEGISE